MPRGRGEWIRYSIVLVVAVLAIAPAIAYAADVFDDVPETNIFHDDIAWMAANGITAGCGGNNFCPEQNVTREQMSAFMKRLATSKVVDAATAEHADHATMADLATFAEDADTVDGLDSTDFYTTAEVDAKIPGGVVLSGAVLRGDVGTDVIVPPGTLCFGGSSSNTTVWGNVTLPLGVTMSEMTVNWYDVSPADAQVTLWRISGVSPTGQGIAAVASSGDAGYGSSSVAFNETVDSGEVFLVGFILPTVTDPANEAGLCAIEISYAG